MAITAQGNPFVLKLQKALGLPEDGVRGFELRCYVNEIITVKCEYYPDPSSEETITERFKLLKIEEEEEK